MRTRGAIQADIRFAGRYVILLRNIRVRMARYCNQRSYCAPQCGCFFRSGYLFVAHCMSSAPYGKPRVIGEAWRYGCPAGVEQLRGLDGWQAFLLVIHFRVAWLSKGINTRTGTARTFTHKHTTHNYSTHPRGMVVGDTFGQIAVFRCVCTWACILSFAWGCSGRKEGTNICGEI